MAYEKHNWHSGDVIYASQLNEMDDQIKKNEEGQSRLSESITEIKKNQKKYTPLLKFKQGRSIDSDQHIITSNIIDLTEYKVLFINIDTAYEYYICWSNSLYEYEYQAGEGWLNYSLTRQIQSTEHTQYLYVQIRRKNGGVINPDDYSTNILQVYSYNENEYVDLLIKNANKNVLEYGFSIQNTAISLSDGGNVSNAQYDATDYIDVNNSEFVLYAGAFTNTYGIVCYDSEKVFIKAIGKASDYGYIIPYESPIAIPIPAKAKYIKACIDKNNTNAYKSYVKVIKKVVSADENYRETLFENVKKKYFEKLSDKGFSFLFATDFHKTNNETNVETLSTLSETIDKMATEIDADFVAYGGDYIDVPTRSVGISDLEWFGKYKSISKPFYFLQGNHDTNPYSVEGASGAITTKEVYDRLNRGNKFIVTDEAQPFNNYGYYDDEKNKVRFILLNTSDTPDASSGFGVSTLQSKWFAKTLYEIGNKDGWGLIILSHYKLTYWNWILNDYNGGSARTIDGETYNYYQHNKAKLIACIYGHTHYDHSQNAIESGADLGFKEIFVNCAAPYDIRKRTASDDGEVYNNTPYTITETAFSVFYVDTDNRKIYETRYGMGMQDREWTY